MADKKSEIVEPVTLHTLRAAPGSHRNRKRIGRGPGSGTGKTAGKGHKGQKARSGGNTNTGFEGGQMPIYRRLPKRGFTNPFKVTYAAINLSQIEEKVTGNEITAESLVAAGVMRKVSEPVKVLGHGDVTRAFVLKGLPASASAKAKIEAAGGRVEA